MSDTTDKAEAKRKHVLEYNAILGDMEVSHNEYQNDYLEKQKDKILRLAKILDESGHPKENICAKVSKDVAKYDIKDRYVRQILPDEYKDLKKRNIEESNRTICGTTTASDEEKKPLLLTNEGETLPDENKIDPIYNRTHEQMSLEAQARKGIEEDKKETLKNPENGPKPIYHTELVSDKSAEFREMEARLVEAQRLTLEQKAMIDKKDKDYFELKRQYIRSKSSVKDEENQELKTQLNNMQTLLNDYNKPEIKSLITPEIKPEEIEILKLDGLRTNWLLSASRNSQKTLFFIVRPKTQEIVMMKTDVEMHQIWKRREAAALEKEAQT